MDTPQAKKTNIVLEFLQSNTFLNVILFGIATFAMNLSPEWLANHPAWRQWLPPSLAAFWAVSTKINQLIAERKQP